MPTGYEGWGALGEVLGGGAGTPGVYQKELLQVYGTDKALQDARRARALAIIDGSRADARSGITPESVRALMQGDPEGIATLGAAVLGSATTPNLRNLGDVATPGYVDFRNLANEAGAAGDVSTANRFNALAVGDDYQPVRELGGAYIEDGVTLGDLDMVPTLPTLSRMQRDEAAAEAAVIKANRPPAPRAPRAPSASAAESEVLAQARERIAGGADPAAVADYLRRKGYPGVAKKIAE